jgi:membrane protein implicated in regulation of membrane protease activity
VAAACSLFFLGLGVGAFLVGVHLGQYGANVVMLSMACLAAAGVYALRVVIQERDESSSNDEQGD